MMTPRNHMEETKAAFEGGATRSEKLERHDLIPPEGDVAAARRFGLGANKHGEGNWKQGGAAFIKATINHLRAHIASLELRGLDNPDNDTDAIRCNADMLCWFRERKPDEFRMALRELSEGK